MNHFRIRRCRLLPFTAGVLLIGTAWLAPAHARSMRAATSRQLRADQAAVRRVLKQKHRSNPVSRVDVQGQWAEATILDEPGGDTGWAALLKKDKGRWRVLLEGQDFSGAGQKYGVPKPLWKRWYLD